MSVKRMVRILCPDFVRGIIMRQYPGEEYARMGHIGFGRQTRGISALCNTIYYLIYLINII